MLNDHYDKLFRDADAKRRAEMKVMKGISAGLILCGFVALLSSIYADCSEKRNSARDNADASKCQPKSIGIDHTFAHDIESWEVKKNCTNVAHRWHIETGMVVCTCESSK